MERQGCAVWLVGLTPQLPACIQRWQSGWCLCCLLCCSCLASCAVLWLLLAGQRHLHRAGWDSRCALLLLLLLLLRARILLLLLLLWWHRRRDWCAAMCLQ